MKYKCTNCSKHCYKIVESHDIPELNNDSNICPIGYIPDFHKARESQTEYRSNFENRFRNKY